MTTITNVGWYLFSTDADKSWSDLKINWGLENCTVYHYIYELSGVPIANETQLGNDNWSPINVGNNNNPSLTKYKAYWVRVTDISVKPVPIDNSWSGIENIVDVDPNQSGDLSLS